MSARPDLDLLIGQNLRRLRTAKGLSQLAIASALGLHRPAVGEIEAGRRTLRHYEAFMLGEAFNIPVWQLTDDFHRPDFSPPDQTAP